MNDLDWSAIGRTSIRCRRSGRGDQRLLAPGQGEKKRQINHRPRLDLVGRENTTELEHNGDALRETRTENEKR